MSKYPRNEHTDAVVRRAYSSPRYARKAIQEAAAQLGWPKHHIYREALRLGVIQAREKEPPWTDREMELLEKWQHMDAKVIAKKMRAEGYARTPIAIVLRRRRFLQVRVQEARQDAGLYTSRQLGLCFGIDSKGVVRWIEKGWLKGRRAGTNRTAIQGGDHWEIREKDVRRFVIDYIAHVDVRKVDKFWLVDLLVGDRHD
jgi:hypothetical protein